MTAPSASSARRTARTMAIGASPGTLCAAAATSRSVARRMARRSPARRSSMAARRRPSAAAKAAEQQLAVLVGRRVEPRPQHAVDRDQRRRGLRGRLDARLAAEREGGHRRALDAGVDPLRAEVLGRRLRRRVGGAEDVVGLAQAQLQLGDGGVALARLPGAQGVGAAVAAELGGVRERGERGLDVGPRRRAALAGRGHQEHRLVELAGDADRRRRAARRPGCRSATLTPGSAVRAASSRRRVTSASAPSPVEPLGQTLRGGQGAGGLAGVLARLVEGRQRRRPARRARVAAARRGRGTARRRARAPRRGSRRSSSTPTAMAAGGRRGGQREAGEGQRRGQRGAHRHAPPRHEQGDGQRKRRACSSYERCRDKGAGEVRHDCRMVVAPATERAGVPARGSVTTRVPCGW